MKRTLKVSLGFSLENNRDGNKLLKFFRVYKIKVEECEIKTYRDCRSGNSYVHVRDGKMMIARKLGCYWIGKQYNLKENISFTKMIKIVSNVELKTISFGVIVADINKTLLWLNYHKPNWEIFLTDSEIPIKINKEEMTRKDFINFVVSMISGELRKYELKNKQ